MLRNISCKGLETSNSIFMSVAYPPDKIVILLRFRISRMRVINETSRASGKMAILICSLEIMRSELMHLNATRGVVHIIKNIHIASKN